MREPESTEEPLGGLCPHQRLPRRARPTGLPNLSGEPVGLSPPSPPCSSVVLGEGYRSQVPAIPHFLQSLSLASLSPPLGPRSWLESRAVDTGTEWQTAHLQPGGHLVPSGLLCLSTWPDDLPVVGDDLGVGV